MTEWFMIWVLPVILMALGAVSTDTAKDILYYCVAMFIGMFAGTIAGIATAGESVCVGVGFYTGILVVGTAGMFLFSRDKDTAKILSALPMALFGLAGAFAGGSAGMMASRKNYELLEYYAVFLLVIGCILFFLVQRPETRQPSLTEKLTNESKKWQKR